MLEYSKSLLNKVSFNQILFKRELKKAIEWVNKEDRIALKVYCLATFGHLYKDVILESFGAMV